VSRFFSAPSGNEQRDDAIRQQNFFVLAGVPVFNIE
jgi:hypothetical protein